MIDMPWDKALEGFGLGIAEFLGAMVTLIGHPIIFIPLIILGFLLMQSIIMRRYDQ